MRIVGVRELANHQRWLWRKSHVLPLIVPEFRSDHDLPLQFLADGRLVLARTPDGDGPVTPDFWAPNNNLVLPSSRARLHDRHFTCSVRVAVFCGQSLLCVADVSGDLRHVVRVRHCQHASGFVGRLLVKADRVSADLSVSFWRTAR